MKTPFGTLSAGWGDGTAGNEDTVGGSVSWLHTSGFNLTGAYSRVSDDNPSNPDSTFKAIKAGYKSGQHAVAITYSVSDDYVKKGDEANSVRLGYVYKARKNIELYAGINKHSLKRSNANFDDILVAASGLRYKF